MVEVFEILKCQVGRNIAILSSESIAKPTFPDFKFGIRMLLQMYRRLLTFA